MKMQTKKLFITIVSFLLYAPLFLSSPVPDPESVVEEVHKYESFFLTFPSHLLENHFSFQFLLFMKTQFEHSVTKLSPLQKMGPF